MRPRYAASGGSEGASVDFSWGDEHRTFRTQVQDFIRGNWSGGDAGEERTEAAHAYTKALAEHGWLTMAWPKEYGGREATHWEQMIFAEESAATGAPTGGQGADRVGPTLMIHGTEEQKREHLPKIASAEVFWCQGYSEPGSGSDLASLQTRATRDGDDFVINGQKIWNGRAHLSDYGWLAARTDPSAPKHKGITLFMVDMKSPGVSVRPLLDMSGRHHFNEVFFEDVRVPRANVVGEVNRGWYHIAVALDFERSGIQNYAAGRRVVEQMAGLLQRAGAIERTQSLRHEVAERAIEVAVGTNLAYRVAFMQAEGKLPNQEASASRVFGTELIQRVYRTAMTLTGLEGQLRGSSVRGAPDFATPYLISMSETIAGGTSEIQRMIIAGRGLGLPRG